MIKKTTFLFFLFIQSFLFSQELEEAIYNATETFISNKNEDTFQLLKKQVSIFKTQVKTKDEQLALIFLQSHKAYFLQEQSKLKEAISTYEDAVNRFYKNKLSNFSDFDIIESCLKPLGNLYTKINDFTNAINTINRYIFLAKQQDNKLHQISGYINLSQLYYTLGKHKYVIATVNDALKLGTIHNVQKKHLETIKTASLIALKQYKVNSNSNNSSLQEEKNNYLLQLQKGNYNQALIAFRNYKASQIKTLLSKRDLSQLHIEEAQLYFLLKESDKSLTHLKKAIKALLPNFKGNGLPNKSLLYAENKFITIFDLFAEIETDYKKALQSFDLSFYVAELLRKNWTSQETKILNDTDNRIRSEKCISILFNAYNQTKNKALLYKAFQYSENNKASVLKDITKKKLRLQQRPKDSLLIKEFELIKHQEQITNLLIKEQLGANESSKINTLSEQLKQISYQLKTLQNNKFLCKNKNNCSYLINNKSL